MSKKYSDKELANILQDMYAVPFEVVSNDFNLQLQYHQFKAKAVNEPQVEIYGSYKEKGEKVQANYPQMMYLHQANNYFVEFFKKFDFNFRLKVSGASSFNYITGQAIDFEEIYSKSDKSKSLEFQIYFFAPYNAEFPEKQLMAIQKLINHSKRFAPLYFSANIIFWKEGAFQDKKISELNLGFNTVSNNYDDDISTRKENAHRISEIVIKNLSQQTNITMEELANTIVKYENRGKLHLLGE